MAPPGTKVLIHKTPQQRRTWDFHGKEGWYIGTAPLHYRCYHIFIPETQGERITKDVQCFPQNGAMPTMSSADASKNAARRLADALANPAPAAPFSRFGAQIMEATRQLANIFATTGAPLRNHTPPASHTCATVQLPRWKHSTNHLAPSRVTPAVPPSRPPRPPPDPPPRVETPKRNPPHRYPLLSREQANHIEETLGDGAVAFLGVLDPVTGKTQGYTQLICGPDKDTRNTELSNNIGRLAQGVGNRVKGTNTIFFIHHFEFPAGNRVTYGQIVVYIRPNKAEKHRVRITVGVYKLLYDMPTATQCASLITINILLNSVVSIILAQFMCADIYDFYYNTPMVDFEYMKLPLSMFPQEIIEQYNLENRKGMPRIKQAGRLASNRLTKNLAKNGYSPVPHTPSLWRHHTSDLVFSLIVNDFGIKYTHKADANHLLKSLREDYEITKDYTGEK